MKLFTTKKNELKKVFKHVNFGSKYSKINMP